MNLFRVHESTRINLDQVVREVMFLEDTDIPPSRMEMRRYENYGEGSQELQYSMRSKYILAKAQYEKELRLFEKHNKKVKKFRVYLSDGSTVILDKPLAREGDQLCK